MNGFGLIEVQRAVQAAVLAPERGIPACLARTQGSLDQARLDVYAEGYRLRLLEALEADYPALAAHLGESAFQQLGRAYAEVFPPVSFSIRWFGRHLPRFLETMPPYPEQPFLAELATFEWALSEAFDAADAAPTALGDLEALPPEAWPDLRLRLHPTLRRVSLRYEVPPQWRALTTNTDRPTLVLGPTAKPWAIWRRELELFYCPLEPAEAWALDALAAGQSFGETCEGLCDWLAADAVAAQAAAWLREWLNAGWIGAIASESA